MSWITDLLTFSPAWNTTQAFTNANDTVTDPVTRAKAIYFLLGEAAILGGIAAAPTLYKALRKTRGKGSRRGKRDAEVSDSLEGASHRATTILAALAPAIGLPLAYITVQQLENANVITKGLGDGVQTMIAAGAVAPAIGGVASLIGKAV